MSRGFRVWDNERHRYVGDCVIEFKTYGAETSVVICPNSQEYAYDSCHDYYKAGRFILEQDTGLTDKNGKEIYEGDIFRNTINGGTWRVYWNEKGAAFWVDSGVAGCSLGEFDWDRSNREYGFIRKNCEVIGNVHEDREDLDGQKD